MAGMPCVFFNFIYIFPFCAFCFIIKEKTDLCLIEGKGFFDEEFKKDVGLRTSAFTAFLWAGMGGGSAYTLLSEQRGYGKQ